VSFRSEQNVAVHGYRVAQTHPVPNRTELFTWTWQQLDDFDPLRVPALINRDADFSSSMHFPLATMCRPASESETSSGCTLSQDEYGQAITRRLQGSAVLCNYVHVVGSRADGSLHPSGAETVRGGAQCAGTP
jgi:hypothetical protein